MKILIVDDSKPMRIFLQHIAKQLDYEVVEAVNGSDGLAKLSNASVEDPFDLALVDWQMPIMNGLEFLQAIRQDPRFDNLKIMMVTNEDSRENVAVALRAGANDFLMKPITKELLAQKLQILGVA